ncbi:MAG: hypothetical protein MRY32_05245 [Rickettsiales bacterium]|nr:hypothetical protein [Rickettsiales bacterium]
MSKAFAIIAGLFFFSLLGLFFMYIGWDGDAGEHRKLIKGNLTHYESQWTRKSRTFKITYDEISSIGFPFSTQIKIFQPRIQMTMPNEIILISTNYLSFSPVGPAGLYKVEFPTDMIIGVKPKSKPQDNYFYHLSSLPDFYVQMQATLDKGIFDELGVRMPAMLTMAVQKNSVLRKLDFEFRPTVEPTWRFIPQNIHDPMWQFKNFTEALFTPVAR